MDIDSLWEYSDPAESEEHFRAALSKALGDDRLELLTQVARTYGLRQKFDEAHKILDEVEKQLAKAGPRPHIRYSLERGRTYNSGSQREKARHYFMEAWAQADTEHEEGLAVDAVHMIAITYVGTTEALAWNQRVLDVARAAHDPKARALIPAILNNTAWDLQDTERFDEALPLFEEALAEWTARGQPRQIYTAKWAVARCLRSLGRHEEALAIQRDLEAERTAKGAADGYVFEEIAENLTALGKEREAKPYFVRAVDELSKDKWFVENEAGRLAHLKSCAGQT